MGYDPGLLGLWGLSHWTFCPLPYLNHDLGEGEDSHCAAHCGPQTQQPSQTLDNNLPQLPACALGALSELPFSQQLLQVGKFPPERSPPEQTQLLLPKSQH